MRVASSVGQPLQPRTRRVRAATPVVGYDSLDGTIDPSHCDADPLRGRMFDCVGQRFRANVEERRLCVLVAGASAATVTDTGTGLRLANACKAS